MTLSQPARADALDQFTFNFVTPPGFVSGNLTIDLPASPTPSSLTPLVCSSCFVVLSDGYIFQFSQPAPGSTSVEFAQYSGSGPLPVPRAYLSFFAPEDLFTGSLTNPTFLTGIFGAEYRPFSSAPQFPGTITIEAVDTTVPEPSTFAMMATGLLGAITTLRSRKARVS